MIAAITGANGFIGQRVCERLAQGGWVVRAIVRRDFESGAFVEQFRGADVVVHAAGATRAPTRALLRTSNVALTERVVTEANRAGVGRFVLVSSQAAAGPATSRSTPLDETSTSAPVEAYGQSKLDAEEVVRQSCTVPWTIVRPAAVYGPGDRDFLALFRLARHGVAIHPGNRTQWISIVHVDDVADAIGSCATQPPAVGRTFFVANDEPAQWHGLFRAAARAAGRSHPELGFEIDVPRVVVRAGAALGDVYALVAGKAGLLTSRKVALSAQPFWLCSGALAKRTLGFAPRIQLQDGFVDTYRWYVAHNWL